MHTAFRVIVATSATLALTSSQLIVNLAILP